jgi:hypothetical protein
VVSFGFHQTADAVQGPSGTVSINTTAGRSQAWITKVAAIPVPSGTVVLMGSTKLTSSDSVDDSFQDVISHTETLTSGLTYIIRVSWGVRVTDTAAHVRVRLRDGSTNILPDPNEELRSQYASSTSSRRWPGMLEVTFVAADSNSHTFHMNAASSDSADNIVFEFGELLVFEVQP